MPLTSRCSPRPAARRSALGAAGRAAPGHRGPGAVTAVSAQQLADHAGAYLAARAAAGPAVFPVAAPGWLPGIAVDGKAVRGAKPGPDGLIPYLAGPPPLHRTPGP